MKKNFKKVTEYYWQLTDNFYLSNTHFQLNNYAWAPFKQKNKYSIYINIKIHKVIVDDLCFFLLKFQFLVMMKLEMNWGRQEDTVDNAGINEKWEFKAAFMGTKLERCDVGNSIRTLKK